MFGKILKYFKFLKHQNLATRSAAQNEICTDVNDVIYKKIEVNIDNIKSILGKSEDLIIRELYFGVQKKTRAIICFIEGLVDTKLINEYIIKSLMVDIHIIDSKGIPINKHDMYNNIKQSILSVSEISEVNTLKDIIKAVLCGDAVLLIDGYDIGLSLSTKGGERRGIQPSETEVTVHGSRESFVETLRVNTSLLRRIIVNENLVFEPLCSGKQTHTKICIAYIDGIVDIKMLNEVKKRLNRIDIDSILDSGYIQQLIEDSPLSPFSTVGRTERPDKIASKLLEGRVAILCQGTPFALHVPYLFIEAFQVPDDYSTKAYFATFLRLFRFIAFLVTLTLPSVYVALTTFHQEMIPTVLLITFASAREGIPFPTLVETMVSESIFQLLRESGLRMPRAVGSAVSVVGTLVIGQAAVEAGVIGAPMVIITAISAMTGFVLPSIYDSIILFKFIFIFLSGSFGLFGLFIGLICLLAHIASLRSFGKPYLAPFGPTIWNDLKDSLLIVPRWLMKYRPQVLFTGDSVRQGKSQMPKKPKNGGWKNK